MKNCEKCNTEHDGSYGSGRFCCSKCARGFSTSKDREAISRRVSQKLTGVPQPHSTPRKRGGHRFANPAIMDKAHATLKANRERRIASLKFEQLPKRVIKARLLEEQAGKCGDCGIEPVWNNKPLVLQLDHKDGNNKNNLRDNLWMICPNCHSQTPTWCGRNKLLKRCALGESNPDTDVLEASALPLS